MALSNITSRLADALSGGALSSLSESVRQLQGNEELLKESLADLELSLDDAGWRKMALGDREFSREGLSKICDLSRVMFLKNPLINRAVTLTAIYCFAQGVTIKAQDEQADARLQEFLTDPGNTKTFSGHQARTMLECDLEVEGNLFFALFGDSSGRVLVRTIRTAEIADIVTDPEDSSRAIFYRRAWTPAADPLTGAPGQPREAYYPDVDYIAEASDRPPAINSKPVMWDSPVYHVRVGGLSDMRFGVPETYQALDWARAYREFLGDWAAIVKALSRFAMRLTTTKGKAGVDAAKAKLNTTVGSGATFSRAETNPAPVAGSTFISDQGVTLEPIKTSGATISAEDGRRLLLMVCAAMGFPETFFGDVNTGNLATAESLDRPTELKFRDRQELWKETYRRIGRYVIEHNRRAPGSELARSTGDAAIDVTFPPILQRDVAATVNAWASAATLNGHPDASLLPREEIARGLLTALGVEDVEAAISELPDPVDVSISVGNAASRTPGFPPSAVEALRELRDIARQIRERASE